MNLCTGGMSGRAASPHRPRASAPDRVPVLQPSGREPFDTQREFEKSVLSLAYHNRIVILKGGQEGAALSANEIRQGYRLGDSDWVDYGGMVSMRQAEAMFGSGTPAPASMRPHSGYTRGQRDGSASAAGTKPVLPYQQYPEMAYQKHLETSHGTRTYGSRDSYRTGGY